MIRRLTLFFVALFFTVGVVMGEEFEAILVKYSAKEKTVTVKINDKQETYKLFETAKFKVNKKGETPAGDFLEKAKEGTKMKIAVDSGFITEISQEKKKK